MASRRKAWPEWPDHPLRPLWEYADDGPAVSVADKLAMSGCMSLMDLQYTTDRELLSIPGIGRKTVRDLREWMLARGWPPHG